MRFSRASWLLLLAPATLAVLSLTASSGRIDRAAEGAPASSIRLHVSLDAAETVGLSLAEGRFVVNGSLADVPAYAPYARAGVLTAAPLDAGAPIGSAFSSVTGEVPDGTAIEVDVRGSVDGRAWTVWYPAEEAVFAWPVRFIQHRVTLLAGSESPALAGLSSELRTSVATVSALQSGSSPTVRVFASREGLIGQKTANGHTIAATDKFVALPSRKVLNPLGKSDYRVRITHEGRSVEAPVWDVGPWNQKDNYWDENREMFRDLPRFVPQAFAAWADNHNGGKDGSGRWVSFPASIDISDAAFIDDLKLKTSSWVDVTFLWVDAPSPPRGPTPAVLGLKPQSTKAGQPGAEIASSAAPAKPSSQPAATPNAPSLAVAAPPAATSPAAQAAPAAAAAAPPPRLPNSLYFPYVPVEAGVDSWLVLQNLADQASSTQIRFMRVDGQMETRIVSVPAGARYSVSASQLVGAGEYSVEVTSERSLAAERSIFLRSDAMNVSGIAAPSRTWLFPEGSTESPMETVLALANPSGRDAVATLSFLGDRGRIRTADVRLAQGARALVNLAEMVPSGGVSTIVESDQPLVAERLTFINNRSGLDGIVGSVAASTTWLFADANTMAGSDAWLILMNPSEVDATVQARFFNDSGPMGERTYSVTARSRAPIRLTDEAPDARFGIVLAADQPIVAERSEFLNDGSGSISSLSVLGATDAAPTWMFPEGASVTAQSETIAVLNPGEVSATVQFELSGDKGSVASRDLRVGPHATVVFDVPRDAAESTLSTRVGSDRPIAVERQIRLGGGRGATGSSGIRL